MPSILFSPQAGCEFSFDYLVLVILAAIIAFMGLLENSSVVLVASMLVSPIMGRNMLMKRIFLLS